MKAKNTKVVFDTNVWISFLIGKRLQAILDFIADGSIIVVMSEELLAEIAEVSTRSKLKKYFPEKKVKELFDFLEIIAVKTPVTSSNTACSDAKDNFLLDLLEDSGADFLVTGDKELLLLNPFKSAGIITPKEFEQKFC